MSVKRILLTPGEPAGIGPELSVRVSESAQPYELAAVCDSGLLRQTAKDLGLALTIKEIDANEAPVPSGPNELACIHQPLRATVKPGQLNKDNAAYVVDTLQTANDLCVSGQAHAVVTGPVQKSIINDAGIPFSGHTEFFADQSHTPKVVMMLATEGLRVALATTHLPLREVADAITAESLSEITNILNSELIKKFGIAQPRILVCGLNPHAGEGGHLGHEEIETISPTLKTLNAEGMNLVGPLPADTLFNEKHLANADAVLAMYHDQGLPVLKYKGFGNAVNITLGLPYIRTSVDHGTALDLAGKGMADAGSLAVALRHAEQMVTSSTM